MPTCVKRSFREVVVKNVGAAGNGECSPFAGPSDMEFAFGGLLDLLPHNLVPIFDVVFEDKMESIKETMYAILTYACHSYGWKS